MEFASDLEVRKIPNLIKDLFDHVLFDEQSLFISDEAMIWDVSTTDPEELLKRISAHYGKPVSMEDLKQPLWKLLRHLNDGLPRSSEMNSKQLADTQVSLPELALGTWGYTGGVGPLRAGIELGATFIDTAEDYETEPVVGEAIRGMRQKVFVATKVAPRNFRRADLIRSAEQSLARLKTDFIDLYQLHWPNYLLPIEEPMAALEELVAAGKVRYIGVSNFSVKELERAQACLSKNRIVSNQVRYNLIDRTIEYGLMKYCEAKKITILAYSPLSRGFQTIRMFDSKDLLGSVANETGKTRSQVALNWCTRAAPVLAIFKANRVEHIRENCGASGWRLTAAQMGTLNQIPFLRRGPVEQFAWRLARRVAQRLGKSL